MCRSQQQFTACCVGVSVLQAVLGSRHCLSLLGIVLLLVLVLKARVVIAARCSTNVVVLLLRRAVLQLPVYHGPVSSQRVSLLPQEAQLQLKQLQISHQVQHTLDWNMRRSSTPMILLHCFAAALLLRCPVQLLWVA